MVDGWALRDVGNGGALIEGRGGIYEVYAGDPVPGLGRVDAIRKQDLAIREAAVVAGIDLPSSFDSVTDYMSGSLPPFVLGGLVAGGLLLILGSARGPMAPQRARRGSAMDVFLGR